MTSSDDYLQLFTHLDVCLSLFTWQHRSVVLPSSCGSAAPGWCEPELFLALFEGGSLPWTSLNFAEQVLSFGGSGLDQRHQQLQHPAVLEDYLDRFTWGWCVLDAQWFEDSRQKSASRLPVWILETDRDMRPGQRHLVHMATEFCVQMTLFLGWDLKVHHLWTIQDSD